MSLQKKPVSKFVAEENAKKEVNDMNLKAGFYKLCLLDVII